MRNHTLAVLALLPFLAMPLWGQAPDCWKCKDEGALPCSKKTCDPKRTCGITLQHRCDALWGAPCCAGTKKVPCTKCKDPISQLEIKDEIESRRGWVERMREYDKKVGTKFSHVETRNFVVHLSIPRYKTPGRVYYRAKAAHLFAERLEKAAKRFREVVGVLPGARQHIFLVPDANQNFKTTLNYFGVGQRMTFKVYGTSGKVCAWPDASRKIKSDKDFHPHVVHQAVHTLVHGSYGFVRNFKAWIDTGLAHWIEADFFKRSRNFCFHEVMTKSNWEMSSWKKKLYLEVTNMKEEKFAAVAVKDLDRMNHRDHAHSWSFVDFLINVHPEKFKKLFAEMKRSNDSAKALDRALGMSTAAFHDAWREYVLSNYGGVK